MINKKTFGIVLILASIPLWIIVSSFRTTNYTWPAGIAHTFATTPFSLRHDLEGMINMAERVVVNRNGSITVSCTEEQRIRYLEYFEWGLSLVTTQRVVDGESYQISEDKRVVKWTVPNDRRDRYDFNIRAVQSYCYLYQLYSNVPAEKITVSVSIVNGVNMELLDYYEFPNEWN